MKRSEGLDYDRSMARQASIDNTDLLSESNAEYERLRAKFDETRQKLTEMCEERAARRLKEPEPSGAPITLPESLRSKLWP